MATLHATRILAALEKARHIGRVEESVTIDGCDFVLQNLTSDDYEAIQTELEGLEEDAYLYAFQREHVCRAIVELGGQDLRGVDFIEDEVPSNKVVISAALPKSRAKGVLKTIREAGGEGSVVPEDGRRLVKLERHDWIKSRILSGWGREALTVAWRKFAEVLETADENAKNGVQFRIPDESSEERYRRLLGELKEVEEDLPSKLVQGILSDAGYQSKSSSEELEAVEERMRKVATDQAAKKVEPKPKAVDPQPDPRELMRNRQPLNRQSVAPPVPRQENQVQPTAVQSPVPEQLRRAAQNNSATLGRSAQIAALEGAAAEDLSLVPELVPSVPAQPLRRGGVPELAEPVPVVDGSVVANITDQPPIVGINPRFRPPGR